MASPCYSVSSKVFEECQETCHSKELQGPVPRQEQRKTDKNCQHQLYQNSGKIVNGLQQLRKQSRKATETWQEFFVAF